VSDVTLVAALPSEALGLAQGQARAAGAAPGVPGTRGLDGLRPTERGAAPRPAEASAEAFAALLQGFWASTQPAPPAPPVPALTLTEALTEALTDAVATDTALPAPGVPAAAPLPLQPGASPWVAANPDPGAGTGLPSTGSGLPVESPDTRPATPLGAAPAPLVPEPPTATDPGPARISLADLEAGRQLRGLATGLQPADAGASATGASPDSDAPTLADSGTGAGALPADGERPAPPVRSLPATAPEFARLVVELAAAPARESPTGQLRTPEPGPAGSGLPAGPAAPTDPGLRGLVGNALQGFPALQPLGEPRAWTEGLGDRLLTLAGPGAHSARLKLHPESLGTLDVEIRIDDGSAQVWFGTSHQQAREAIESSLPRLREMFADQGLNLVRAQVDSGAEQRTPYAPARHANPDLARGPAPWARPDPAPAAGNHHQPSRLLDVWA